MITYGAFAVHVSCWPVASDDCGQLTEPTFGAVTAMLFRVSCPVLPTRKVYGIESPASTSPSPLVSVGVPSTVWIAIARVSGVLVIMQSTVSPTATCTSADEPAAPLGSVGSVAPLRVQAHEVS